jgi:ADP-heptose:LPS heptosyltransferase
MVNKILIFRTDRIGDLIVTCPTIISIKKYFKECDITIITSNRNFDYAKSLNLFGDVLQFPRNNLISKIKFIYNLYKKKFDYIFVFDGKERSILTAAFIKSKIKVALSSSIKFHYKLFKIKFFKDCENTNLNEIFQQMLNYSNVKVKIDNYDFIKKKRNNNFSNKIPMEKFVHIHLDEKWFSELYISSYTNINPKYEDFIELINSISKQSNILITTGIIDTSIVYELKNKFFEKIDEKIYYKKNSDKSIYLIYMPSFEDIESLLRKSKILIACHGSITHAANSFDIQKIDILEGKKIKFYKRFTSYLEKYHPIYRSNFVLLRGDIMKKIQLLN